MKIIIRKTTIGGDGQQDWEILEGKDLWHHITGSRIVVGPFPDGWRRLIEAHGWTIEEELP